MVITTVHKFLQGFSHIFISKAEVPKINQSSFASLLSLLLIMALQAWLETNFTRPPETRLFLDVSNHANTLEWIFRAYQSLVRPVIV